MKRLVVHYDFRRLGLARMLDRERVAYAKTHGGASMLACAPLVRSSMLAELGFRVVSKVNWLGFENELHGLTLSNPS